MARTTKAVKTSEVEQTASTTTSTTAATSVSSSAKSFGSDVQGNFLMFRIVH